IWTPQEIGLVSNFLGAVQEAGAGNTSCTMSKLIKLNLSAKTCATLNVHSPLEMRHPAEKPVKTLPLDFLDSAVFPRLP
ncbi:hypothetical protein, partial [Pseudomonas juntendi]|uniref:hypothetical protein n=1 Tax=Pseudomonas juntendi TaxID=2666183 RepID=UPI003B96294B